jgi:hypothetical protein
MGLALYRLGRLAIWVVDPQAIHCAGLAPHRLSTFLDVEDSARENGTTINA